MKAILLPALLAIGLIAGCHGYAHLYPVEGPLAHITPPPIYTAKLSLTPEWNKPVTFGTHAYDRMGKISVVLASGETFNGTWKETYDKSGAAATAAHPQASDWDAIYGKGYYTAHVLGTPILSHRVLTGSKGTTLTVEWYEEFYGSGENARMVARGIAQDSKGNLYKLVF